MTYDLSNPFALQQFLSSVRHATEGGRLVEFTVKKDGAGKVMTEEERRTYQQHKTVWMWFSVFAEYAGYEGRQKAHDDILNYILGKRIVTNKITGEDYEKEWHTSEMSKAELSDFMDKFKAFAMTDYQIYLPYYGDAGYEEMVRQYGR